MISEAFPDYGDIKAKFPEKFNFEIINQHFEAFAAKKADLEDVKISRVKYAYDHLRYQSDIRRTTDDEGERSYYISMSNDGFLYPDSAELQVFRSKIRRRRSETWCMLDKKEISKFPSLVLYAQQFLKLGNEIQCQVFYNFIEDRLDFKAFNRKDKKVLVITFEPGYPVSEFEDHWMDLPETMLVPPKTK